MSCDPASKVRRDTERLQVATRILVGLLAQHQTIETESGARDLEANYFHSQERMAAVDQAVALADLLIAKVRG